VEEHEVTIARLTAESAEQYTELTQSRSALEELEPVAAELRSAVNAHAEDLSAAQAALAGVTAQLQATGDDGDGDEEEAAAAAAAAAEEEEEERTSGGVSELRVAIANLEAQRSATETRLAAAVGAHEEAEALLQASEERAAALEAALAAERADFAKVKVQLEAELVATLAAEVSKCRTICFGAVFICETRSCEMII
jgi:chromosome segregation ATPase